MERENYWTRRLNRRGFVQASAIGAGSATALALVGCGDDDDDDSNGADPSATEGGGAPEPTTATSGPKRGGTLTIQNFGRFSSLLDPHVALGDFNGFWNMVSNLIVYPDAQTVEPVRAGLVESWEQVDDTTLTLTVRPEVFFHEGERTGGRQLTAADIAFNIERIAGKLPGDEARMALFGRRTSLAGLDSAEAVDGSTVSVSFTTPNAIFLNGVADWRNNLVAPELVDQDPDFLDPENFAGTGPFTVSEWDSAGNIGTLVRNPNYWEAGKPYIDEIREVSLPDPSTALAAFLSGQTDFTSAGSNELRSSIEGSQASAKIVDWEYIGWRNFRFNPNRIEAFQDPRVRRALFLALNYSELMDANAGEGFWNNTGPIPSGFPGAWTADEVAGMAGWNPDTKDADITEARRLMTEAGFPDGEIEFSILSLASTGTPDDDSIRLQGQWQSIWPDMDISFDAANGTDFNRQHPTGDFDGVTWSFNPAPAALLEANLHYSTGGGRNYGQFSNAAIDDLINQGISEFDSDARAGLVGDLQVLLLEEMPIIPIGKPRVVQAHQERIRGFEGLSGPGTFTLYDIPAFAKDYWIDEA